VQDGDDVVGVMVRVEDVTLADEALLRAARAHRDVATILESYNQLAEEVEDLRRALRTRPTIEQAKGIIMAARSCSADEAFTVLRQLSMDTNVRLAEVAAAVVYHRRSPE
jgi:two-component system, response regulator / RNA-binding antiterminator